MSNYTCGKCCFKQKQNKEQRLKMFDSIDTLLTSNPGLNLLCADCDKQIALVNGVIKTSIPYESYSYEDKQRALAEANLIMNKINPYDLEEKASLQLDFFELMRKNND